METKNFEIYKHPYKWNVTMKFGTYEQMLDGASSIRKSGTGNDEEGHLTQYYKLYFGGSFNKKMDSTSRAALINLGLEFCIGYGKKLREVAASEISSVDYIHEYFWEGVYTYNKTIGAVVAEMMKKGLYPVSVDWDGKTYIERWRITKRDKYGVPIVDSTTDRYYELTDTYRY